MSRKNKRIYDIICSKFGLLCLSTRELTQSAFVFDIVILSAFNFVDDCSSIFLVPLPVFYDSRYSLVVPALY